MTKFIGQSRIVKELSYIIPLARDRQESFNILLSARSGYGKTFLALSTVSKVGRYQILIKEDANDILRCISLGKSRAIFVDEIHLVKNIELLYPVMDSREYFLMFATNQSYELTEAFKRRCIPLVFERYTKNELCEIARNALAGLTLGSGCLEEIVRSSNYIPGNIDLLCIRIRTVFGSIGTVSLNDLKEVLVNIFNIQDGLDVRCREYLEVLERLGHASLDALSYVMGVGKDTVKNEVESVLLSKGLIQITSKGRSIK